MMPNKTIYVREADLPLFERAQEQLGDSISSMFAEFLRERLGNTTPEENKIIELLNQIGRRRQAAQKDSSTPGFVGAEYAEAEEYAEKALSSLRSGKVRNAKALFFGATVYYERAEKDFKWTKDVNEKIKGLLRAD